MRKNTSGKLTSLLLTLALLLGLLPAVSAPASAAGMTGALSDSGIGLAADNDGTWSASGTTINGEATGTALIFWGSEKSSTLTITNNKQAAATLSFDYKLTLNGGSATIGGAGAATDGSFTRQLQPQETIAVSIVTRKGEYTTKIELNHVFLLAGGTSEVTFRPAEGGSYTVNGQAVDADGLTQSNESSFPYQLNVTPDPGYKFLGWKTQGGGTRFSEAAATLYFDQDTVLTPWFVPEETAVFSAGGSYYTQLNEAISALGPGGGVVAVAQTGILAAGDYQIPSGVTLLVPFDGANTVYTTKPENTKSGYTKPTLYRKLALSPGANLTIAEGGAISVGGKHTGVQNPGPGSPTGPYGQIQMEDGSSITVQAGGKLYAYGFITGSGEVTALSGSEVWEYFQIADWRGGTASSKMNRNEKRVFPFSQYYVQNIEAPLTVCAGATEMLYTSIYSSWGTQSAAITFVGDKGLFQFSGGDGSFKKQYLPGQDRLQIDFAGDLTINEINVQGFGSGDYVLPINSNISIHVLSGTACINKELSILPGAAVTIAQGAELSIQESGSLFLYDREEWVGKNYIWPNRDFGAAGYTPTRSYKRAASDLTDGRLDINGTVTAAGGLYTTAGGADITSSQGSGKLLIQTPPQAEKALHEVVQSNTNITYQQVPISPAVLQNTDGSTAATAGAAADSLFSYDAEHGKWSVQEHTHSYDGWKYDGTDHWKECRCGDKADLAAHSFIWKVDQPATEAAAGLKHEECSVCGYKRSEGTVIDRLPGTGGGSGGGGISVAEDPSVRGTGDHVSIAVSGGSVSSLQMKQAVSKASKDSTITIQSPEAAAVTLAAGGMADAADNRNALLLDLRHGKLTLSSQAVAGLTEGIPSSGRIKVSIVSPSRSDDPEIAALLDKGGHLFEVSAEAEGKHIDFSKGTLTLQFTAADLSQLSDPRVVHIRADGAREYHTPDLISGSTITVKDISGPGTFLIVPGSQVPQPPVNPYTDISTSDYFYDAVLWAAASGMTNGTNAAGTLFSPDLTISRAQMVTLLWRAHGAPKAAGSNPFYDVSADDYYYDAVLWAAANGVTDGTGAASFSPDAPVTRSQALTFQWRASGRPAAADAGFDDVAPDAYYADAVAWAAGNRITTGTGGGRFSPDTAVSRAQAVTLLYRELAQSEV